MWKDGSPKCRFYLVKKEYHGKETYKIYDTRGSYWDKVEEQKDGTFHLFIESHCSGFGILGDGTRDVGLIVNCSNDRKEIDPERKITMGRKSYFRKLTKKDADYIHGLAYTKDILEAFKNDHR
jgi:hypothetical protein